MDPLIVLLQKNAKYSAAELAEILASEEETVVSKIEGYEADGTILGYQAVVDSDKAGNEDVVAFIEVKMVPEREGGFDRLAKRIARFDQVTNCFLMSGGYDLVVIVEGRTLRETAQFVSEKLSSLDGVQSTATHFQLKVYKQNGLMTRHESESVRIPVSP